MGILLRVLFVEDSENDVGLEILALRRGGYEPSSLRVETAEALATALESEPWDIALCDYSLPHYSGADALALINGRKPDLPVIIVSGVIGEEVAVRLAKAGAHDYVMKDHLARLPLAVDQAIRESSERRMRRETQRTLRDTALQLRSLLEAATDAVFEIDGEGTIRLANEAAHRVFGWPPGELLGRNITVIIAPDRHDAHRAGLARYRETGQGPLIGKVTEVAGITRDGVPVPCELSLAALGHQDESRRFVGIVRDITERKRAEAQANLVTKALEAAVNGIVITDPEGTILWVNPAVTALTGYGADEVIGRNPRLFNSGRQDRTFYENLWGTIKAGRVWHGELVNKRKDGSVYTEELVIAPVRNEQGVVSHFVAIKQDISERKLLETQAQRLERLAMLGQLLSGIAHELKNPLFIVTGRLQLMEEKLQAPPFTEIQRDIQPIADAAGRMTKIVERFLRLAKPVVPAQSLVSVEQVVQQTLDFVANELLKQKIAVVRDVAPDVPQIQTDPQQLQGVFLNLILNAIQAMAEAHGRGTLTVRVALVPDAETGGGGDEEKEGRGDTETRRQGEAEIAASPRLPVSASAVKGQGEGEQWIEVRIQDDGPGVLPEHRARLFEPFFTTKEAGKGTGLGLWIARTTMVALRGTIGCESEAGHGATFIVRLPVEKPTG